MAKVSMGDLSDRLGDIEEQRSSRGHVSDDGATSFLILPDVYPQDRVSEALRAPEEPRHKCCQVPATNACHQP